MKIAEVAPVFERVVSYLTEGLVQQGHEVTLFATGGAITSAHLVPPGENSQRLDIAKLQWLMYQSIVFNQVLGLAIR